MVKTLNYSKEVRESGSTNAMLESNSTSELSPRKRKARGMFINDEISSEVIIVSDQSEQKEVPIFYFIPANLMIRAKKMILQPFPFLKTNRWNVSTKVHIVATLNNK